MAFGRMKNKKLETEKSIFEAAMNLFREKGFVNTTMQDISERAGVAKGTVFNYFTSKEEILLKFGKMRVAEIKEYVKTLPPELDTKSKITRTLVADFSNVEKSKDLARIVLVEAYKYDWVYTLEAQNRMELASIYMKILSEGKKKGDIRSTLDCKHIAGLIVAIYFHALYTGMEFQLDMDIKDYLIKSVDVLWNGIHCQLSNKKSTQVT